MVGSKQTWEWQGTCAPAKPSMPLEDMEETIVPFQVRIPKKRQKRERNKNGQVSTRIPILLVTLVSRIHL